MPNTLKPTPKVAAGGVSGLAAGLLVFIAKSVLKIDLPEEIAISIVGIATWAGSYLKRDKSSPVAEAKPKIYQSAP